MANDNGEDIKTMIAEAMIGRRVVQLCIQSGLVVPRQKPGRKPLPPPKVQPPKARPQGARPNGPQRVAEAELDLQDE